MFRESLLESAPAVRRRSRLSIATAFTLQLIIAGIVVLVPLISTGILTISARTILPTPPRYTPLETKSVPVHGGSTHAVTVPTPQVITVSSHIPLLSNPWAKPIAAPASDDGPSNPNLNVGPAASGPDIPFPQGQPIPPVGPKRIIISHPSEAMLVNKVIPEYPSVARLAGVQGDVKLHAIIDKDGTIQSLTVTSGPDMLRDAAIKAVQQWRYRPYMLNGVAVEVETVITVSFHRF